MSTNLVRTMALILAFSSTTTFLRPKSASAYSTPAAMTENLDNFQVRMSSAELDFREAQIVARWKRIANITNLQTDNPDYVEAFSSSLSIDYKQELSLTDNRVGSIVVDLNPIITQIARFGEGYYSLQISVEYELENQRNSAFTHFVYFEHSSGLTRYVEQSEYNQLNEILTIEQDSYGNEIMVRVPPEGSLGAAPRDIASFKRALGELNGSSIDVQPLSQK